MKHLSPVYAVAFGFLLLLPCSGAASMDGGGSVEPPAGREGGTFRHIVLRPGESRFRLYPLTNYVNTAIDTAQVSNAFSQDGYWHHHSRVFERIVNPLDAIAAAGGWDELFRQELLSGAVLPNLTLHLLGNGYDFRVLAEWFDHYRVPFPFFWAFLASYAGYVGNEAIEVSNPEINAIDHISDLYFFNLVGNLLFISDSVTDLVHNRWQLRNWAGQPVFDARQRRILNASNNYVLRPWLWSERVRPFLYFGLHYFVGFSMPLPDNTGLSLGAGLATTDPFEEDEFAMVRPSGGIFWDDQDRLLTSIVFNGTDDSLVRVNLYPDLLRTGVADVGFFLGFSQHGVPVFGVAVEKLFAIGLS